MSLQYVKHEKISLKSQLKYCEAWLHERICEDPTIIGLGDLAVLSKEKKLFGSGRIDMVLADVENSTRYEVEVMLGATDPSHIIRCIEYWDIERRRYPGYDHVAVLIAEDITSRFLNVVSLLAGTLPLVAIQLDVLRIGEQIALNFVKVLDQRSMPTDDEGGTEEEEVSRENWETRVGANYLKVCDRVLAIANEVAAPSLTLEYRRSRIRLCEPGAFFNVAVFFQKKMYVPLLVIVANPESWAERAVENGLDVTRRKGSRLLLRLTASELEKHEGFVRELIQQATREQQNSD
jgi:hypothetical protein